MEKIAQSHFKKGPHGRYPPELRARIVSLVVMEGYSRRRAAKFLGVSDRTIRRRLSEAWI